VPDEGDPRRIDVRQTAQVTGRDVEVVLQCRGGGVGRGSGVRQRAGVGAVPGEVEQHHHVAAGRQGVAELRHQLRRTREAVRDHHCGTALPGFRRVHHVQRDPADHDVPAGRLTARPGQQPPAQAGRHHDDQQGGQE
jgi:hypothetical protein